jgi:uncharacterized lipoprotein YddW (UPF0748 family)
MNFFRRAIAASVILVACPGVAAQPSAPIAAETTTRSTSDEVRGLWVIRSTLTSPARINELIRSAIDGGYNTLLVQVRGRGDAYYQSSLEPRAAELAGQPQSFDPLALTIERAHAAGLTVHAWLNVNLVAGAATPPQGTAHIAAREPGWLMVPRQLAGALLRLNPNSPAYLNQLTRWTRGQSNSVEGLFLSPIPEASQQYTLSIVRDLLARYALDGLHLDYIRYPTNDFDYSAAALEAFRAHLVPSVSASDRTRLDGLAKRDPLAWTSAYPQPWEDFRRERLNLLVERIRGLVREARPTAILSAAVVPVAADARRIKLQDWSLWARTGLIDVVCPMAYATTTPEFTRQMADTKAGAFGRPVWAGIGAWRLPVARTAEHIRAARRSEAAGILMFSYDGLMTAVSPRGRYFAQLRPAVVEGDKRP